MSMNTTDVIANIAEIAVFRLLEAAHHMDLGVMEYLIAGNHGMLTVCPECHVTGFKHLSDCTLSQPPSFNFPVPSSIGTYPHIGRFTEDLEDKEAEA